jgi:hypothetical protein
MAGSAFAAPKVCKKDCPPLPAAADTTVFWGFGGTSLFFEAGGRTCSLSQLAPDFSSGTYDCELGAPLVDYYLDSMTWTQTFKRGDPYFCERSEGMIVAAPDLKYSYSWSGDCTDEENGGCDITIVNRTGENTLTMYGSITFEYFIDGVVTADPDPFTEEHDFMAGDLRVTKFSRRGNDKVLAICEATPVDGTVSFHTAPKPLTPE